MNMTVVPWYASITYVRMTCARATHAIMINSMIQPCNSIMAHVLRVARARVREQTEEEVAQLGKGSTEAERRAERREVRALLLDRIDAKKVDAALEERGAMAEPELLILKGGQSRRSTALHGFPPWPLRLSEI